MTMKFTKDSGLVKTWVSLVLCGVFTLDQVPNLFNLKPWSARSSIPWCKQEVGHERSNHCSPYHGWA